MNITLSPELQKRIAEKVMRGDVGSADALVEHALTFYLEFEEGGMDEEEFLETKVAIDEALEQGDRGEGRPAEHVFARLRAKHGIPRRASAASRAGPGDPFSPSHSGSPFARPAMAERAGRCPSVPADHAGALSGLSPILKTRRRRPSASFRAISAYLQDLLHYRV